MTERLTWGDFQRAAEADGWRVLGEGACVIPDVLPFWRAVLGYVDRDDGGEDLLDPRGLGR
jgi:hypothetical protein